MSEAALRDALRPVIHRIRRGRALRGVSLGLGGGALLAAATGALPWLGLGALGGLIGHRWPLEPRRAVSRLDAAAELDGALRCAWDHRRDTRPIVRAQQKQALAALAARGGESGAPPVYVRAAPAPAPGWLLGPLLAILPLLMPPAEAPDADPSLAGPNGGGGATVAALPTAEPQADPRPVVTPTESPEEQDPRVTADAPDSAVADASAGAERDAGPRVDGDGGVGGTTRAEGVAGRAAGEGGSAGGSRDVAARPGVGPALVLPTAAGVHAPGDGPAGRLVVGRTPPPPDAIADPARPYPSRYRVAIAAWFDRSRP